MKWQPIETAPKDGTGILLFMPSGIREINWKTHETESFVSRVGEGLWTSNDWHWANDSCGCCWEPMKTLGNEPTKWMPLPEPPQR